MNYTVTAQFEIRAKNRGAAEDAIRDAIVAAEIKGLAPVATFRVVRGAPRILDKLDSRSPRVEEE